MMIRMKDGSMRDVTPDVAERLYEYGVCEFVPEEPPKKKTRKKAVKEDEPERQITDGYSPCVSE